MIPIIIILPLLAALAAMALAGDYKTAKYLAMAGSLGSLLLFPLVSSGTFSFAWLGVGGTALGITTMVTPLNSMLMLIVLVLGALAMLYSWGFIELPSEQKRFYFGMLAFEAAMLAFAMAGNFITLFIAWEFLSVTSYLLIGFWNGKSKANAAARKAVTIILIGDLALLGAMAIFLNAFGTLEFGAIISAAQSTRIPLSAMVLLVVAILTKSAQFPFGEWLTDAMEGPTPVSALLHSSTMVKAGVFVAAIMFPVLAAGGALWMIFVAGAITAVIGAVGAIGENQIKRVLAYSTMQEMGLMLMAIGANAVAAAVYFFFAQSFYKALLFFSAGISIKATGKENLDEIGWLTQNRLVYISTIFGVLAMAGFVPFDGFFANAGLAAGVRNNLLVYAFVSLVGLTTSFYTFRWFILQTKKTDEGSAIEYAGQPKSMVYSLVVLAIAALVFGAAFFWFGGFITGGTPSLVTGVPLTMGAEDAAVTTAAAAAGFFIGYVVYARMKKTAAAPGRSMLKQTYVADALNAAYAYATAFMMTLGEGIAYFDDALSDSLDKVGRFAADTGNVAKRLVHGEINIYIIIFAAGMLLLLSLAIA
ncbi:F(420)H(2) dehydrogenase subunit L [uncultured archaeon]|nr:F(420)H(2) dehydrogenase subunit L [uncultured archaeon]